jgi:hypothetical protein
MRVKRLKIISGVFLVLIFVLALTAFKGNDHSTRWQPGLDSLKKASSGEASLELAGITLPFVANEGQWEGHIKYQAGLFSGKFLVTEHELVYSLPIANHPGDKRLIADPEMPGDEKPFHDSELTRNETTDRLLPVTLRESFLTPTGSLAALSPFGQEKSSSRISYFEGNDPDKWRSGLASYSSLSLGAIYPGIEVELKASGQNVEKLFYLRPGANVEDIRIRINGADSLKIDETGELILSAKQSELAMMKPVGFQEENGKKMAVEVAYELKGQNEYGFKIIGSYDPQLTLVIDPALSTLSAATYLGGTGNDRGFCLALDNSGHVYVAGYTLSSTADFPTTDGAYDRTYHGGYDLFVSRFSSDLKTLEASTYFGGAGTDYLYSMALDSAGYVYLAGATSSNDFPIISGAFQAVYQGGEYDGFVAKLSGDLSTLLASTFLGGSGTDQPASLILDSSFNIYLTGTTSSADFPITPGAYSQVYKGGYDVFVAGLSNSLNSLLASTYIGGGDYDIGSALVLGDAYLIPGSIRTSVYSPNRTAAGNEKISSERKSSGKLAGRRQMEVNEEGENFTFSRRGELYQPSVGNGYGYTIYVAGRTKSSDFGVTAGAYDQTFNGGYDGFIFQISPDLSELYISTYLGGSGDDHIYGLARDHQSKILVAGYTASADYPVSAAAYSSTLKGGFDLLVSKLSASLDYLLFSSYFGGTSDDYCRSIKADSYDNVYLTGWTQSTDFPATSGAFSTSHKGGSEAIVCKISSNLQVLLASTYLGGAANDLGYALALDDSGNVYVTGYTSSTAFPVTEETYDDSVSGTDVFVAKFGTVDQYLLTVNVLGSGQVVSHDGGIDTGFDNSQVYDTGTKVILEAIPAPGYIFGGWGGDVHSTDATLTLTMNSDKVITAKFAPEGATYMLTVLKSGSGSGTVTSDDEAINCGTVCSQTYTSGTLIKLTATPDEDSGFEGWSGDISSTSSTVPVIINGDMTIIAVFGPPPLPDLTGEWHDLKITRFLGRTTIITGFFELKNISKAPANYGYTISYYLSSDGISLDTPLNTRAITLVLLGERSRKLMFTRYVEGSINVSGKYLVAVIDEENVLTEEDKTNNLVVYGPLP